MKRALFALLAVSVIASGAFAGPKTIKCPVMTANTVDIATATKVNRFADFKGRRYYFCCNLCPQAFKADPKRYAKNASIPKPK